MSSASETGSSLTFFTRSSTASDGKFATTSWSGGPFGGALGAGGGDGFTLSFPFGSGPNSRPLCRQPHAKARTSKTPRIL